MNGRLDALQQAYGVRATEDGLLADIGLRRAFRAQAVTQHDWVHAWLADGPIAEEFRLLIKLC